MKLFLLFLLFFTTLIFAEDKYTPFIEMQISYAKQMNENNITHEVIEEILSNQKRSYTDAINSIMSNKQNYLKNVKDYKNEIFSLNKIININKRAGNTLAVARDEIQVGSYELLKNQNYMIKSILDSLNHSDSKEFAKQINDNVVKNQLSNQDILSKDYSYLYDMESSSKILDQAKSNLYDFYALVEINNDAINYLYYFENRMYRLNKYSRYHLISTVLYINSTVIVQTLNPILKKFGLNVIKLLAIIFLILSIYFIRKVVYVAVEGIILNIESLKKYSQNILDSVRKPLSAVIIIINMNMIIYVYNDFHSVDSVSRFFNVIYGFYFTFFVFKVVNVIAKIKIYEIDTSNKQVKNEIINVGIKIANFIIMLMGMLIMLYLAGVNLTAVLSGLGIGGFAVALAAKDSLANFFGTLSILLSDVFSQGDWIVVDGKEGVVVELGLRVTTLRTFDNALIAIPNATLANKDVKNWNKRELGRRIKMSLGIKYDSKSEDIQNAVKEIREMLDQHPKIATENTKYQYRNIRSAKLVSKDDLQGIKKTLLVYLDEFSDSSINILVYCFTKSTDWDDWLVTKEDVMYKIMAIFEKNSLEFAFPSLSLYSETDVPKVADSD